VSSLPGQRISDQAETPIGEVKEIFATDDGYPMWVAGGDGISAECDDPGSSEMRKVTAEDVAHVNQD
jgi:hypothetical protein